MKIIRADVLHVNLVAPLFDAYRQFYGQASDAQRGRAFVNDRLARGESVIFIAMDRDRAIGFTQLYPSFTSISLKPLWIVYDLFVAPDARRCGAGSALLQAAQRHAAENSADGLILDTAVDNVAAQKLYEKLGWKRDALFHRYNLTIALDRA